MLFNDKYGTLSSIYIYIAAQTTIKYRHLLSLNRNKLKCHEQSFIPKRS